MNVYIRNIASALLLKYPLLTIRLARFFGGKCQMNINLDLLNLSQKKVLLCYLHLEDVNFETATHANFLHGNQMLKCLIDVGYCVDVCSCDDKISYERLKKKEYDMIIGQGLVFKKFCKHQSIPQKILFVTENNPVVVIKKSAERIEYFKQRHPQIDARTSLNRVDVYLDEEMFLLADYAIVMNSEYNVESMRPYFKNTFSINSNAFFNSDYEFSTDSIFSVIDQTKSCFLWFGSNGLIHKGVDLLIDSFREMPDYSIDFYGLGVQELALFNQLKAPNTNNCGRVNVQSQEFIEKVVNKHCFVIFPSCSEGMSTAIATCMAHGIIPILTKESGFDPCEYIIELDGWKIGDIKDIVQEVLSKSNEELLWLRRGCYYYARENFSLKHFDKSFREILQKVVNIT